MQLIYATGNPAKLESMRETITPLGIEILSLRDIDVDIPEVTEIGATPLENARLKAMGYYEALRRPLFACDSGLYIDGLPETEQPGVNVRMVNGKRLSDDEMIVHYAAIARRLGGRARARYRNAICLVADGGKTHEHFGDDISGEAFYLVDTPHSKRVPGFPLDCLSVHIASGEYYYDRELNKHGDAGMASLGLRAYFKRLLEEYL